MVQTKGTGDLRGKLPLRPRETENENTEIFICSPLLLFFFLSSISQHYISFSIAVQMDCLLALGIKRRNLVWNLSIILLILFWSTLYSGQNSFQPN